MFTNHLLKAIATIFLLAFISLATGCTNDEEYIPKLAKHAVRFTDNEEIEPGQPEVINIDAQQQTIVLTVKNSEMASLKMKYDTVGEWDEKKQDWQFVWHSDYGNAHGEYYDIIANESDGSLEIEMKIDANNTEKERRLLIHVLFKHSDYTPFGLVEIKQGSAIPSK